MNEIVPHRMTVEEYLVWAHGRPGRWELVDGRPIRMSPETTGHISVKVLVVIALLDAIEDAGIEAHALGDGATVRIAERTAFEPDALVYSGPALDSKDMVVPEPIIVVEVVSPSSGGRDSSVKLDGYFRVPSLRHYLIVDGDDRTVIHHTRSSTARDTGAPLETRILYESDPPPLAPPGISIAVRRFFSRR